MPLTILSEVIKLISLGGKLRVASGKLHWQKLLATPVLNLKLIFVETGWRGIILQRDSWSYAFSPFVCVKGKVYDVETK